MEKIKCLICSSDNHELRHKLKDQFNKTFNLVECKNCRFVFLNPRPDKSEIKKYYSSEYHPHENKKNIFFIFLQKISYMWKFYVLKKYNKKQGIHLDVGSGDASFTKFLKNKKWISFSYDKYTIYANTHKELSEFNDLRIDLVTFRHSLEHMHNIDTLNY